jgi:predicted DNA-binding protein (UPF0278 family)
MAEPTHYLDAEATRDMISEELLEVTEKIREGTAQVMKFRAAFRAACRSGSVDSDTTVAALALLRRAEDAGQRWRARLTELRQRLDEATHGNKEA